jgi:hypothetical protein
MKLFRVMCVDVFELANDPEAEAGYEVFAGTDEAIALQWAQQQLARLEQVQPTESSGGQSEHGIQDRVYIEKPDGSRYRVLPTTEEGKRIALLLGLGKGWRH